MLDIGGGNIGRGDIVEYRPGGRGRQRISAVQGTLQDNGKLGPGDCVPRAEAVAAASYCHSCIRQTLDEVIGGMCRGNIGTMPAGLGLAVVAYAVTIAVLPFVGIILKNIGVVADPVTVRVGANSPSL